MDKKTLDRIYHQYNRREFVHPDPLEFLYHYADLKDIEIVGLIASSLAYGKVDQILKKTSVILDIMGSCPSSFLENASHDFLLEAFSGFAHRFATGEHMAGLLTGAKRVISKHGSLWGCFIKGMADSDETILPGLTFFANQLAQDKKRSPAHLIPLPQRKSACKRLNLFLRWMVRKDEVDPGGWDGALQSKLIVPVDTHMHKIGIRMGFTNRKQADMKTAMEITQGFKKIVPLDPVRYDFSMTRFGIRDDLDPDAYGFG